MQFIFQLDTGTGKSQIAPFKTPKNLLRWTFDAFAHPSFHEHFSRVVRLEQMASIASPFPPRQFFK